MEFDWDEAKNQANIRKHGVSFATAKRIFDRPVLTWHDRRRNYGEDRYVSIGQVEHALIVVAHIDWRMRKTRKRPWTLTGCPP